MRVLVTGAAGQVGSALIHLGRRMGQQMIAAGHADLDITQPQMVSAFLDQQRPDILINAAAYTAVDKAEQEADLAYAINRNGPEYLALACKVHDIPLLQLSTDYVFDGAMERPYIETDTPNPLGVYGRSKLEGERAVNQTTEKHIILRVAWVFGSHGHNFVRSMLRLGKEHAELRVVADQHGGPTWSGDIAALLLSIVERYQRGDSMPWGTYHFTGEPSTSWHDFAKVIFEMAVSSGLLKTAPSLVAISTTEYPTPAQRPRNSNLNCEKIRRELGIAQPNWRIGLANVLNNWRES